MQKGALHPILNMTKNLVYVGTCIESKCYGADYILGDEQAQVLECYEEQKDKTFRNKEELIANCMDDVSLLREACCAFRNFFLIFVRIDPFRQAITISSICNMVSWAESTSN